MGGVNEICKFKEGFPQGLLCRDLKAAKKQPGEIWGNEVVLEWGAFQAEGTGAKTQGEGNKAL